MHIFECETNEKGNMKLKKIHQVYSGEKRRRSKHFLSIPANRKTKAGQYVKKLNVHKMCNTCIIFFCLTKLENYV